MKEAVRLRWGLMVEHHERISVDLIHVSLQIAVQTLPLAANDSDLVQVVWLASASVSYVHEVVS